MSKFWWQRREKGGKISLKITIFLINLLPYFLLKFIILIVSFFYYLSCKNERENIKFYLSLLKKQGVKTGGAFLNFYNFSLNICDKFRARLGKINLDNIDLTELNSIKNELKNSDRGFILLGSHFGNIEIMHALKDSDDFIDVTLLFYSSHAEQFFNTLNSLKQTPIKILKVDEFDVNVMIKLKEIIDNGGHIGIMADRVPVSGNKTIKLPFLGQECEFPISAFILAHILKAKIGSFWAVKDKDIYKISFKHISDEVMLSNDRAKSAQKYLEIYVKELEDMCKIYPHQFFNFYDFWQVRDDRV